MEVNEVFANLKTHMLEGMVFHDEMSRYYDFLGMGRCRDEHRVRYEDETNGYVCLCRYYMHHFNKLIPQTTMNRPDVIPDAWYMYKRQEVDTSTKRTAYRNAMNKWVEWEKQTKDLYEDMCSELLNNGEIAAAHFVMDMVRDVDDELKYASDKQLSLETSGYDLSM